MLRGRPGTASPDRARCGTIPITLPGKPWPAVLRPGQGGTVTGRTAVARNEPSGGLMPRVVITSLVSTAVVTLVVACGGGGEAADQSSDEQTTGTAQPSGATVDELTATLV